MACSPGVFDAVSAPEGCFVLLSLSDKLFSSRPYQRSKMSKQNIPGVDELRRLGFTDRRAAHERLANFPREGGNALRYIQVSHVE